MKKIKKIMLAILMISVFMLIQACSSIDEGYAEFIAKKFVKERVKFFSKEVDGGIELPVYNITSVNNQKEGGGWIINLHIEAKKGNQTKKNDMVIKINGKGNVFEFNGNKVDFPE